MPITKKKKLLHNLFADFKGVRNLMCYLDM